jgi:hypothetical protein
MNVIDLLIKKPHILVFGLAVIQMFSGIVGGTFCGMDYSTSVTLVFWSLVEIFTGCFLYWNQK